MSATAQTRDVELGHAYAYAVAAAQLHQFGATIQVGPLPDDDVARWDSARATLHLHPDTDLEDRVWVMGDLVRVIAHGVETADACEVERVRLVS